MAAEQRQVFFDGDVQGVGFRYTACRVAGGYDVTGYVRNLPDGRVECLVEGDADQIDCFLVDLSRQMRPYIRRTMQQTLPAAGSYDAFTVRF